MRIQTLFDQGSVKVSEDCHLAQPPFFVVADGVSPPWSKANPLLMVEGRSAGAVVSAMVCDTFASAIAADSAYAVMVRANTRVGITQQGWSRPLDRPDLLAGAAVVAVKLDNPVEIVHAADAIACWRLRSGEIGFTANLGYAHEEYLLAIVARLMEEVRGDREQMWERYYELRCASLREHTNRRGPLSFSVLNGQPEAVSFFQVREVPRGDLKTLIICSDGFVPFEETRDLPRLADWVFAHYDEAGLQGVLMRTRERERQKEARSHESRSEATAIAIHL